MAGPVDMHYHDRMESISADSLLVRKVGLLQEVVSDGTLMMDLESGRYFGVDSIGGRIWTLLEQPLTFSALCDVLEQEYAVDRPTCEADVRILLARMKATGLIHVDPGIG